MISANVDEMSLRRAGGLTGSLGCGLSGNMRRPTNILLNSSRDTLVPTLSESIRGYTEGSRARGI